LIIISGNYKIIRYDPIKYICNLIDQNQDFIKTLHDCMIIKQNNHLIIYKELNKIEGILKLGNNIIWDNRFRISLNQNIENYYISNINMNDYIKIKDKLDLINLKNISFNNHHKIMFTLPVIVFNKEIKAIPHINYYNMENDIKQNLNVNFYPQFTSRFTHFE